MALLDPEQRVGARDGQAVVLADRRADDELDVEEQVAEHAAHDHDLLGMALAHVQPRRPDEVEELQHHRRQAVEVPGSRRALELAGQALDRDAGGVVGRVEGADVGQEADVDLGVLDEREVAAWSRTPGSPSSSGRERVRVDEARDDDAAVLGAGAPHERQLAVVEHPHRRHEADAVAGDPALEDRVAQLVRVMDDDHERRRRRPGRRRRRAGGAAVSVRDEVPQALGDLALREHRPVGQGALGTEDGHLVLVRADGVERPADDVADDQVEALVAQLRRRVGLEVRSTRPRSR